MKEPHRVAVVGSINRDDVAGAGMKRHLGWGGILFNVAALLRHGRGSVEVSPVAYLGTDAKRPVGKWLAEQRNVHTGDLIPLNHRGNLCRLRYKSPEQREERLLHRVPSLTWSHLRPALATDLTLVNYISGTDVSIHGLERFRQSYRGIIYIDVHSLVLGRRRSGMRYVRRPAHWDRVVRCGDIIQLNECEFETLSRRPASIESSRNWASAVLTPTRCRCLLVTRGHRGAVCLYRHRRGWRLHEFPAPHKKPIADPTGAGDTFSGAWIANWLTTRDYLLATRFATRAAARPARPVI